MSAATVTLTDDDKSTTTPGDKDGAELSITRPTSANVSGSGSNAEFTVTLSAAVDAQVQVAWSGAAGDGRGGPGADLGPTSGTVTFAANSRGGGDADHHHRRDGRPALGDRRRRSR